MMKPNDIVMDGLDNQAAGGGAAASGGGAGSGNSAGSGDSAASGERMGSGERMVSGDTAAFLRLIGENKGILFKICRSYCRNKDDREDLMQEMIYQLWRSGQKFDATYKFSTWMYRIALNVAISFYRKESRSGFRLALGGDVHLMDLEDRPEDNEELEEKIDLLQQFISELGELDKALMILYLEERPYREIAEILGISETNVATKLSRIKGRLKQQFLKANNNLL